VVDILAHSERPGVMRLLLSYLDDPHAPPSVLTTLARRSDATFLKHLMKRIGCEPSAAAKTNLKRMDAIQWVRDDLTILDELDDAGQHGAVQMAMASGMSRLEVFGVIQHLSGHGKPGGRRAATDALAQFKGAQANELALGALADEDPTVQANVVVQLRQRGIPGAMTRLIDLVDSPHEEVRRAARECLTEFSFQRFLSAFDMLDDDVRCSTGLLVKKIDPTALSQLTQELRSRAGSRRRRGVAIAQAIDVVDELEETLIELLSDEDHLVRADAATALGQCNTRQVAQALREALLDRSVTVQEAAQRSLMSLARNAGKTEPKAAAPAPAPVDSIPWPLGNPSAAPYYPQEGMR